MSNNCAQWFEQKSQYFTLRSISMHNSFKKAHFESLVAWSKLLEVKKLSEEFFSFGFLFFHMPYGPITLRILGRGFIILIVISQVIFSKAPRACISAYNGECTLQIVNGEMEHFC